MSPPRATALPPLLRHGALATRALFDQLQQTASPASICASPSMLFNPVSQTAVPTVFRYVASRNKRGRPTVGKGLELPYSDLTAGRTPGVTAIFDAKRRIAGLPMGGFGPRDPLGSQKQCLVRRPILRGSSSARPPRAANASLSPRTAIPHGIALFALGLSGSKPAGLKATPVAGLRCGRLRYERPYGSQKLGPNSGNSTQSIAQSSPHVQPNAARKTDTGQSTAQFSAPYPPHCGSAFAPPRLPSPAGISSRFCSPQNE